MTDAPVVREDTNIYPLLVKMLGCLEAEFTRSGLSSSHFTLVHGAEYALDMLGEGECEARVWVHLITAFPSAAFPSVDETTSMVASPLAYEVQVGVARCAPTVDRRYTPSVEEYLDAARMQMADMAAMRRAICACLVEAEREFVLATYEPQGPLGGLVWGTWTLTIGQAS